LKQNPMAWFMADKGEVGTAYLHRSTATLAGIASILGAITSSFSSRCRTLWNDLAASRAMLAGRAMGSRTVPAVSTYAIRLETQPST
jgi:hypothetical protein